MWGELSSEVAELEWDTVLLGVLVAALAVVVTVRMRRPRMPETR